MAQARAELGAAGFERVTLWTFQHNPASRGFYERLGFVWDGTETRDDRRADRALRAPRQLNGRMNTRNVTIGALTTMSAPQPIIVR